MNKISYFRKIPRACIRIHKYVNTCSSFAYSCFMHAYAYTGMRTYIRVLETMKDKFFCIKDGFRNEYHIV